MNSRTLTEDEKIARAVSEGYPDVDVKCSECGTVFKNYHHFIRCESKTCPMSDDKGTLLDRLITKEKNQ
jgi:uncharacterized Zn finger protein